MAYIVFYFVDFQSPNQCSFAVDKVIIEESYYYYYYFNVRSKADRSQLNLPHGTDQSPVAITPDIGSRPRSYHA